MVLKIAIIIIKLYNYLNLKKNVGSTVCNGDSGGGMVFKMGEHWFLRGIVSVGASRQNDKSSCSLEDYVVFTDVARFTSWINNYLP